MWGGDQFAPDVWLFCNYIHIIITYQMQTDDDYTWNFEIIVNYVYTFTRNFWDEFQFLLWNKPHETYVQVQNDLLTWLETQCILEYFSWRF